MSATEELSPRQYAAQLLVEVPPEDRETWLEKNVPARLRAMVRSHVEGYETRVQLFTQYVTAARTKDERNARLAQAPQDLRASVRAAVMEKFAKRAKGAV